VLSCAANSFTGRANSQAGGALVTITFALVGLFAFAALSIDLSCVYIERSKIQESCDSAALAAVRDWALGKAGPDVTAAAKIFATANGLKTNEIMSIKTGYWTSRSFTAASAITGNQIPAVQVVARRDVSLTFAPVIGLRTMSPRVESVAVASRAKAAVYVLPWAICDDVVTYPAPQCTLVTLKYSSLESGANSCRDGDASRPNFGALALGDDSTSTYQDNILNGYPEPLHVGDCVKAKIGNLGINTSRALDDRLQGVPPYTCTANPASAPPNNKRLAVIPRVATLNTQGSGTVCITGFYVVALDSVDSRNPAQTLVDARILYALEGTQADPSLGFAAGVLASLALVK
jgi:Flp pilus assembly protein TadG